MKASPKQTIVISGVDLGDESYTNDHGSWNVTRAKKACKDRQVWGLAFDDLWANNKHLEVEPHKMRRLEAAFRREPLLREPLIHVTLDVLGLGPRLYLIDGVHRMHLIARGRHWPELIPSYVFELGEDVPFRIHWFRGDGVELNPQTMKPKE